VYVSVQREVKEEPICVNRASLSLRLLVSASGVCGSGKKQRAYSLLLEWFKIV